MLDLRLAAAAGKNTTLRTLINIFFLERLDQNVIPSTFENKVLTATIMKKLCTGVGRFTRRNSQNEA